MFQLGMQSSNICQNCSQSYPIHEGELHWCHHCNWNLEGDRTTYVKENSYQKIYRELGKKMGQGLFNDLVRTNTSRPRMNLNKVLAYSFASVIHLSTLIIFLIAFLSFAFLVWWVALIIAVPLFAVGWVVLPKPRKWPEDMLDKEKFPTIYGITNQIAREMKTSSPAGLIVNEEFNASYSEYGLGPWKKKVITLGLPLLNHFTNEEIVGVIAHETSHGANGDVGRGAYLWAAVQALANWHHILHPSSIDEGQADLIGGPISTWISNIAGWMFSFIPYAGAYILAYLMFRQSQEAEYLADRLAAEVCGSKEMMAMLSSLSRGGGNFYLAVQRAALSKENLNVFDLVESSTGKKSSRELERLERIEVMYGLSLDATHPPSSYRRNFLAQTNFIPKVVITLKISDALRSEIDSLKKPISNKLKDAYLNRLYC
ncbi:heat shock protein HtpX [compost metagenome]